ncbi:Solute carrier family 66 member 2 [Entamoeba marina]
MICTPVAPYLPFIVSKNKKQTFESFNIAACYVLLSKGLPLLTLVGWVLGDTFKTVYFVSLQVPIQFIMCGVFQLICDAVIFAQIAIYSPHVFHEEKVELPHDSFTFPKKR